MRSVVLTSGGLDSATLARAVCEEEPATELMFVDYGQPAAAAERRSAHAVAQWVGRDLIVLHCAGIGSGAGEIVGRNLLLVSLALAARPHADLIALGIHGGTPYRDCSPAFVELAQRLLDFHTDGRCRLSAPFLLMSKVEVVSLAREYDVPVELTHSCEAGDIACGRCASCEDREALDVG